jgi:hypothetical protein
MKPLMSVALALAALWAPTALAQTHCTTTRVGNTFDTQCDDYGSQGTRGGIMNGYLDAQEQPQRIELQRLQIERERLQNEQIARPNVPELERQCQAALRVGQPAPGQPCMQLQRMGLGPFAASPK